VVADAHTMSAEAQNALLKTLEEPPANTVIILISNTATSLLPTVRSRCIIITVKRPAPADLKKYFTTQGFADADIDRALLMSGGLPGLAHAILTGDDDHPMMTATATARRIIQGTRFGRLTLVDALSKQREQAIDVCQMLQRMAHVRLQADPLAAQWQRIITVAYDAEQQLVGSGQPKLVLTNLLLSL
jgi:DNA polymerase III subunit delta'